MYLKSSRSNGQIGIWWYTDNKDIWAKLKPTDQGYLDGLYYQYDNTTNHLNTWRQVVADNVENKEEANTIIAKGYKSLERGRVIYNTATQCYEVICSKELVNDKEFRDKLVDAFNLSGNRVEFNALSHYYKSELTGNPALDSFEYEV